jgi:hypothetical protein
MKSKGIVFKVAAVYLAIGIVIGFVQLLFTRVFQPDCKGTIRHTLWEGRRTADQTKALQGTSDESFASYLFRVGRRSLKLASGRVSRGRCRKYERRSTLFRHS